MLWKLRGEYTQDQRDDIGAHYLLTVKSAPVETHKFAEFLFCVNGLLCRGSDRLGVKAIKNPSERERIIQGLTMKSVDRDGRGRGNVLSASYKETLWNAIRNACFWVRKEKREDKRTPNERRHDDAIARVKDLLTKWLGQHASEEPRGIRWLMGFARCHYKTARAVWDSVFSRHETPASEPVCVPEVFQAPTSYSGSKDLLSRSEHCSEEGLTTIAARNATKALLGELAGVSRRSHEERKACDEELQGVRKLLSGLGFRIPGRPVGLVS